MAEIAPENVIDREAEQELFEELVRFETEARLLTVRDREGGGKSTLLRRLQYNCKYRSKPSKPASLVLLHEIPDPFTLIQTIRKHFPAISFHRFTELNNARAAKNLTAFAGGSVRGAFTAEGATVSGTGNTFAGVIYNSPPGQWTPDVEEIARERCIEAFFEDVREICQTQPVVVLLDCFNAASQPVRAWVLDNLIYPCCFDDQKRLGKFVLVVAGEELPNFEEMLGETEYTRLVRSIKSLGEWSEDHVKAFLKVNGHDGVSDKDIQYICRKLKEGWSLQKALNFAAAYL